MIIEVKHGYSYGLQLDAHYTWSKALDFTGSEAANAEASSGVGFDSASRDLRNFNNNYHLSYSDIPHRFVVTAVYELPFGPSKHFQLGDNRVLKGIAAACKNGPVGLHHSGFLVPFDHAFGRALY